MTVSNPHAVILSADGEILVEDLRSKNGTWTPEGLRIPPGGFHPLYVGETFQVGTVKLRLTAKDERRLRDATSR
jgi:pSer/pThr/pTyr-binding forkhead associated (FHA) protein